MEIINNKYTATKVLWRVVKSDVDLLTDKPYNLAYIRDVAHGYRSNKRLSLILKNIGVLPEAAK